MIVDTQTQEHVVATDIRDQVVVVVQDLDLMYVGGGTGTGVLF